VGLPEVDVDVVDREQRLRRALDGKRAHRPAFG
jgi:hypothetical protein